MVEAALPQPKPKVIIQYARELELAIGAIKLLANVRVETGELVTPDGTPFRGFKVTIGGITDPSQIKRTYDDIENLLHQNKVVYKEHEEHRPDGKFKSFSIEA